MRKKRIAVFTNGWSNEFLELTLSGIIREAKKDNTDVFVFMTYIFWDELADQVESKLNIFHLPNPDDYDGAIMLTNTFTSIAETERICRLFRDSGIPMISTEVKIPRMAFIGTSNYEGVYDLATHLVEKHNVKRVVYVSGIPGNEECAVRRKALEDVLAEHGLELMDTFVGSYAFLGGLHGVEDYLDAGKELPDAFVCANDHMALGVINALHKRGIESPRDVIVTGFDSVYEAMTSYPLVTTVTRQWNHMGEYVYQELQRLIDEPNPDFEMICNTKFVPSESCGCPADEDGRLLRIERIRNLYASLDRSNMIDQFFQTVQFDLSKVESKEAFYTAAIRRFSTMNFLGKNYCIITSPRFFHKNDPSYRGEKDGYGGDLDILLEMKDGKEAPQRKLPDDELYPGYKKDPDRSEVYVFAPLSSREYSIGYLAIRNKPEVIYELIFQKWITNLSTLLYTIRQYIRSQQMNRQLREIYMSDFLTEMYNRTGCESVIFSHIDDQRMNGKSTVLLFVDIDNMKLINDDYGHLNGDLAIKATATAMREPLDDKWLFGRYGGDEFVAVGDYVDDEFIENYRKDFKAALSRITSSLKVVFPLTASVGYTVIRPDDTGRVEDFIAQADQSMYEQKKIAHRRNIM